MKKLFPNLPKTKTSVLFFALLCAFVLKSTAQCDVTDGLIEQWKFDGSMANSISANTAVGTGIGYYEDRFGVNPGAYVINNWDQIIRATTVVSPGSNNSIALWIKRNGNVNATWGAIGAPNSNGDGAIVCNNVNYGMNLSGTGLTYGTAPATLNVWHHLVITRSGTSGKLYYDGALVLSGTLANNSSIFFLSGFVGTVGSNYWAQSVPGLYDDYRIYNKVLSATEVQQIYNATVAASNPPIPPTITVNPANAFLCGTQNVQLASLAVGTNNTYQWQKDGVDISGATNDTLVLANATVADAGSYRLIATNACGADTSTAAQLIPGGGTISSGILHVPFITQYGQLNFKDYGGNNLNPTFTYMGSDVDAQGTAGSAIILNGTQNGQVAHNSLMNVTNQVTLSCWFNANNITTAQRLLDKTPANNGNNFLLDLLGSKPRFIIAGGSHTLTTTLSSATWYHVAATYNGAQVKIYINGMLAYTGNQTGNCVANTLPLMIGADQASTTRFTGRLDEIRMYNTALTDLEIYGLYAGPKLVAYPSSVVTCAGNSATLSVQGSGTGYTYQWQKDGVDISGANAATYTDNSVAASDTGSYTCVLSRNCYSVTSAVAKLNLPTAFNASTSLSQYWPFNNSDNSNAITGVYFNIANAGFAPDRQGAPNNALNITSQFTAVSLNNSICCAPKSYSLWYKYTGTSAAGRVLLYSATSNTDLLYIYGTGQVAVNGSQVTSSTLTTGQWYHFVMTFTGTTGTLYINGAVAANITGITNSVVSKIGNNNNGQSAAVGVLDEIRVYDYELSLSNVYSLYNMAAITTQPATQTVCAGQSVSFTVAASSAVTYQWKKGGNIIPSATSATYTIASAIAGDAGSYTCEMTDACSGVVMSTIGAALTVTGNVAITQQPTVSNATPTCGTNLTFSIIATDVTSYQWRKDGVNIQFATGASFIYSNASLGTSGAYDCIVGGCLGNDTSAPVTVTVQPTAAPTGLLHHWKLNNNFTDAIAANNLTATGAYIFQNDRYNTTPNAAFASNANNAFVLASPVTKDTITVSLWYYHMVSTGYKTLIADTTGRYSDLLQVVNNEIKWSKGGSGTFGTGIQLSIGWHHIAITKQGNAMQFFVDGALAYTPTNAGSVPAMGVSAQINRFGNTAPIYNTQPVNGGLDDIRIYNSVLSASQIEAIYSEPEIYSIGNFSAACIGGSSSVTVNVGSLPTTQYQWQKDGSNINGATSATLTVSNIQAGDAGNYTCVVRSTSGCASVSSTAAVLTPGAGNVSLSSQPQAQIKCVGQPATFSVTTSGAAVTFQWKKDGNAISGQTSTTLNIASVSANDAGTYTCDIIGGSCGAISTTGAVLTVNTPAAIIITPANPAICAGSAVTLTASGASTYNWSNSGGSNAAAIFTPSATTTYTVTGTDANSCSATASKSVTVNALPNAAITGGSAVCTGSSITLTANGGTGYAWANALGSNAAITVSPSSATTYTVTVTNANNCSASASQTITVNANPTAGASANPATICNGQNTTLTATGGNSYTWSNGLAAIATNPASPSTTTTYAVTVTNTATGCSATASASVTVNPLPTAAITGTSSVCPGASTTLTATGGSTYVWSNSGGSNAAATFSPSANTTYTVTVTNASNCSATAAQAVTVVPVSATINGPSAICSGLSATLTASGGSSYAWSNNETTASITVTPTTATTYTVTATLSGCSATASQSVSVQSAPTASITGATTVCSGESLSLTANGGNTYAWSNNLGSNATVSISPTATTTYSVTASLGANCSASASHTVEVLQPSGSSFDQTICNGESFTFDGNSLSASGAYTRTIANAVGCDSIITLNLTVLAPIATAISETICAGDSYDFNGDILTQAGTYYDTLTSVQSCDSVVTLELTIGVATSITSQPVASTTVCSGLGFSLDVVADGSNVGYEWIKDNVVTGSSPVSTYAVGSAVLADAGIYKVAVSGTCGADTSDEATVVINATPVPVIQQSGAVLTSSVTGAAYQWFFNNGSINSATLQSYTATQTGDYKVEVTSADGCTGSSAQVNIIISGIEDVPGTTAKVYPNPATDILLINTDAIIQSLEVYNVLGEKVLIERGPVNRLQVSGLAQGTYVLSVSTANGVAKTPFVKN